MRPAPAAAAALLALACSAAGQGTPRIAGTWTAVERVVPEPLPLKDAARAPPPAGAARDCAPAGMPALLDTRGAVEISQQADKVLFRYAEWDVTRTVHTNPRNGPATQDPSALGVSFGRWEGETLSIFTTYIAHPYFDRAGTPQSRAVTVLERYTPSADGVHLDARVTVTDAATFARPVVITGALARAAATPPRNPSTASTGDAGSSTVADAGSSTVADATAAAPSDGSASGGSPGEAGSPALVAAGCIR